MVMDREATARRELESLKEEIAYKKRQANDSTWSAEVGKTLPTAVRFTVRPRQLLRGHFSKVYAMAWSPDSQRIVSASQDGKLIVWHATSGLKACAIPLRSNWMMTCDYSPATELVACGGLDNLCSVYQVREGDTTNERPKIELSGHTGYVSCVRFQNAARMLTCAGDQICQLWDINSGVPLTRYEGHDGDVLNLSIDPNNEQIFLSSSCDGTVKLWDMRKPDCQKTFIATNPASENRDVNTVDFHPSGFAFSTGAEEGTCRVFDIRSYSELTGFGTSTPSGVTATSFSRSGRFLFTGYDNSLCLAWDLFTGTIAGQMQGHDARVSCVGVSHDGLAVCTGSWDTSLKVWA